MPEDYFQPELIKITKDNIVTIDCDGELIDCISVDVHGYNYEKALEISGDMWCSTKKGAYGKGLGNTESDPKKVERTGRIGEIAFAMVLGLPVDATYREKGDKYDFIINGKLCDMKTSMDMAWDYKGLITGAKIKTKKDGSEYKIIIPLKNEVYVFGYIDYEDRERKFARVIIVGYILKRNISLKLYPPRKKYGDNENHEVPYIDLNPITELRLFKEKQSYKPNENRKKETIMWKQKVSNKQKETQLINDGYGAFVARLLSQRNIPLDQCSKFIDASYDNLSDPYALNGVEQATKLFCTYARNKEKIAVIGDYDCDGITSSSRIYEVCRILGTECYVFLPSRFDHGYGLNEKTIASFKEKVKTPPSLLMVLDCGTNNYKEIEELKAWGIKDIIVIDHHLPNKEIMSTNATTLINWHLTDGFNEMCAAGEVFQFIRGIRRLTKKIDPIEFVTYAAIGTIADSSPIIGDNRIIARHGLSEYALSHIRSLGLKTLMSSCRINSNYLTQMDVSFQIAPRINATGRMSTPDIAFRLLTEYNLGVAEELTLDINDFNSERKQLQGVMESQALEQVKKEHFTHGVLLKNDKWHIGIIGNVASRIAEKCNKPTIIFGYYEGKWRGSGRTVNGINIKGILDQCKHIFVRYGGHAGAIGCELKPEYVETASKIFDEACKKYIVDSNSDSDKYYDASVKVSVISKETAILLNDKLSPYCRTQNPEPIFKLSNVNVYGVNVKEGEGWKVMTFNAVNKDKDIPFLFKYFSPKIGSEISGQNVNLYFTFPQKWNDNEKFGQFELTIVDVESVKD